MIFNTQLILLCVLVNGVVGGKFTWKDASIFKLVKKLQRRLIERRGRRLSHVISLPLEIKSYPSNDLKGSGKVSATLLRSNNI